MRARGAYALIATIAGFFSISACGGDGSVGGRITTVGTPSPDLPTPAAPAPLLLSSCTASPDRVGVGQWRPLSLIGAPALAEAAVWTGTELVVANTQKLASAPPSFNVQSISAYDPVLDRWRDIAPPAGVALDRLSPYLGFVAGRLLLYGGYGGYGGAGVSPPGILTDGWMIDLQTGAWTAMVAGPVLAPANGRQRVFSAGTRALLLPEFDQKFAAATYDVATGEWATVPYPTSTPRGGCVSPGWNGRTALCGSLDYLFVVTPDPLSVSPFPKLLDAELTVSSAPLGDRFFAWGFPDSDVYGTSHRGFLVDPLRRTWGATADVPQRANPLLATVNGRVVIWGGNAPNSGTSTLLGEPRNDGAVFDPTSGTWSPITCIGAPTPSAYYFALAATNAGLVMFSGSEVPAGNAILEL
jgi:hypothetical protein